LVLRMISKKPTPRGAMLTVIRGALAVASGMFLLWKSAGKRCP